MWRLHYISFCVWSSGEKCQYFLNGMCRDEKQNPCDILYNTVKIIELLCKCITHLPSSCMRCCSFTLNGTASETALKQVSSSFVTGPRGNEQGELDVLSNYGKDKKSVRFPCQGPLMQHQREQLSLINQRWDTDLQWIRENIKGRNIGPCTP